MKRGVLSTCRAESEKGCCKTEKPRNFVWRAAIKVSEDLNVILKDLKKTAVCTSGSVMSEGGRGEGLLIEFYLKGVATIAVALVGILGDLFSIR